MEPSSTNPPFDNDGGRPPRNPKNFEMFEDEFVSQKRDVKKKKKVHYRTNSPAGFNEYPSDDLFQIPESDRNRNIPALSKGLENPQSSGNKPTPMDFHCRRSPYDQSGVKQSATGSAYDNNVPGRSPLIGQRNDQGMRYVGREQVVIQNNNYDTPASHQPYQGSSRGVTEVQPVDKNPSLICKAINYDGEPVTVNNEVVRDKLILSCRPRSHYGVGSFLRQKPVPESDIDTITRTKTDYRQTTVEQREYTGTGRPEVVGGVQDSSGKGMGERMPAQENQYEKYEEQYRIMQCRRYRKNFKMFLWALFLINLLLLLVGITLLILSLYHILFRSYINVVIQYSGYAFWMFGVFFLSIAIIFVATYGIITALTRSKKMLCTYIILAAILALVILIWLLVFWILQSSMKSELTETMVSTFNVYRCTRNIRIAWDDLQESYQCCGREGSGDWKYIPPSCCQGQSRFQKQGCIGHFIQEEQAFKGGCRGKIEEYFTKLFLIISCLLVLAIILLLLDILVALRLLKMYKIILKCREIYMITP